MNKCIPIDELQIGMYISAEGNDWVPENRRKRKGYIRTQATIDKIKSMGVLEVCIDISEDSSSKDEAETLADNQASRQSSGSETTINSQADNDLEAVDNPATKETDQAKAEVTGAKTTNTGGLLNQIQAQNPDNSASRPEPQKGIAQLAQKHVSGHKQVSFSEEIDRAKVIHNEAILRVEESMHLAKLGKPFDIDGIESMADSLIESIVANRNTLSMMTAIKNKCSYLYEHSVNCGVLMGVFAEHLKLSDDVIHDLVTGAILHDIGMTEVSDEILTKEGMLAPAELKEMQRHPILGRKILEKNRGVPAIAIEVCKQHHERLDGQGYMSKLHSHQINQYGRMAAIVDSYDALTSDRSYRKAFQPAVAMKMLLESSGGYYDVKLVNKFIQCINIYPVGSLVQLDDTRVGVVHELNKQNNNKPIIKVFYNAKDDRYLEAETIDLDHPDISAKIIKTADIRDYNMQLEDLIE